MGLPEALRITIFVSGGLALVAVVLYAVRVEAELHVSFHQDARGRTLAFGFETMGWRRELRFPVPRALALGRVAAGRAFERIAATTLEASGKPSTAPGGERGGGRRRPGGLVRPPRNPALAGLWQAARAVGPAAEVTYYLTKKAHWRRLSWTTTVGLGDAASTGVAAGALWATKGIVRALARAELDLAPGQPEFRVDADFAASGIETSLAGIGALRVGHIMLALAWLALAWLRRPHSDHSGRRRAWPNTRFKAS
ncbi:MAG: DUF2953 domain-containing protein [Bacillota bacterium]|nr:MAG: DUF2953 domain-containing protein [Bacillota bacterium]